MDEGEKDRYLSVAIDDMLAAFTSKSPFLSPKSNIITGPVFGGHVI